MSYNTTLQSNNADLLAILDAVNDLPEAGSGEAPDPVIQELTVTENGTYTAPAGVDGYSPVTVSVPETEPALQEKYVTPSKSAQAVTPDSSYDGLSKVNVEAIPDEYIIPSGTKNVTENGNHDVKQYESVVVNVPIPEGYVKPSGTLNITENGTYDVTEKAGVSVAIEVPEPVLQDKNVSPKVTSQTVTPDAGYDGLSSVTVEAMPTATQAIPSISVDPDGLITASATQSAGYVSSGTKSTIMQLSIQAAQTITPGTTDKTIPSGKYLTGTQTIKGDVNLVSANIVSGKTIFGVAGTAETGGGSSTPSITASAKEVNFYDYDGTLLHSYTVAEAQALTDLPTLPERAGLICQGWNYDLATIKSHNRALNIGAMYTTDDGTTRIYIHLEEGRTSPMLGVCPNGTVTIDWGDGTTPNTLTGTSTSTVKWTPNHNYSAPGDYVIKLTVNGSMGFAGYSGSNQRAYILRYSSGTDSRNQVYQSTVRKIEIGNSVTSIGNYAFGYCYSLSSIVIPNSVTSIGNSAFEYCYSLSSIVIPNRVTSILYSTFNRAGQLSSIVIPNSVTSIGNSAFDYCYSLSSIVIPNSVTSIGNYVFRSNQSISSIVIPNRLPSIAASVFYSCYSLSSIVISNSVTSIGNSAFEYCCSLSSITIPSNVAVINSYTFSKCYGIRYYDFSNHTAVPTLSNTNAFSGIVTDCEILVPAALYDEWIAATNWSTYASYIKAV